MDANIDVFLSTGFAKLSRIFDISFMEAMLALNPCIDFYREMKDEIKGSYRN